MYGADQKQGFRSKWSKSVTDPGWGQAPCNCASHCRNLLKGTVTVLHQFISSNWPIAFWLASSAILVTVYFKEIILSFFSQGKSWTTRKRWWAWHPRKPRTRWPTWTTRAWRSESKCTPETHCNNQIPQSSLDISSNNHNQLYTPSSEACLDCHIQNVQQYWYKHIEIICDWDF